MSNTNSIQKGDAVIINGELVGKVKYVTGYWIGVQIHGERGVYEWHPQQVRKMVGRITGL